MSNVALKLLVGIVGLAAGESYAFVVDGGMEITARQTYVIGAGSSVTYTPPLGLVVSGPSSDEPSQPQTYTLTGRFDIEFYRYWWRSEISMDGGTLEDTTEQFWAQLISTELYGAESLPEFDLPRFSLQVIGDTLYGNSGPCFGPMPPNTYCTGFSTGLPSELTGIFQGQALQLDGLTPAGLFWGAGYSYHINAVAAVPLPSTLALLVSGVAGLLGWRRRTA
ncbi:PEP-CTERM sorting domain-containing protein [Methylocaldum sp.]|uniref:PEP-CTERM sorting domain-containing protein n=2 Tax=unclassified Methylocaldum TaxID=2622260 RepID=UPI0032208B12